MVFDCGPIAHATDCVCVPCCMDRGRKEQVDRLAAAEQRIRELESEREEVAEKVLAYIAAAMFDCDERDALESLLAAHRADTGEAKDG